MAEINRLYGKALYDASVQQGNLETCLEQASQVRGVLEGAEIQQVLKSPLIPKPEKMSLLQEAFSGTLVEPLRSYLELLIDKNREEILDSSLEAFLNLGDHWRGLVEAHVVSAAPLRADQVTALQGVLSKKLQKQVEMSVTIDPSLIGGFYLNVDGYTVDSSVRRRLQDMKHSIERGEGFDGPQT